MYCPYIYECTPLYAVKKVAILVVCMVVSRRYGVPMSSKFMKNICTHKFDLIWILSVQQIVLCFNYYLWSLRWSCLRNALPHTSHGYGRSSVWVLTCMSKLYDLLNSRSQYVQMYRFLGLPPGVVAVTAAICFWTFLDRAIALA